MKRVWRDVGSRVLVFVVLGVPATSTGCSGSDTTSMGPFPQDDAGVADGNGSPGGEGGWGLGPGADSGTGSGPDAASSSDALVPDAPGFDASVPLDPTKTGSISVTNDVHYYPGGQMPEFVSGDVIASFSHVIVPPMPSQPAPIYLGACVVNPPGTVGGQVDSVGAGTLTLSGPSTPSTSVVDSGNHLYDQTFDHVSLLAPGQPLQIRASGDNVPPFLVTVLAPAQPTLVAPSMPDPESGAATLVSQASDLTLTWAGGGDGSFGASLGDGTIYVICTYPANAGTGTIPSSVLQMLHAPVNLFLGVDNQTSVAAGPFGITVSAGLYVLLPDGHIAIGALSFQ